MLVRRSTSTGAMEVVSSFITPIPLLLPGQAALGLGGGWINPISCNSTGATVCHAMPCHASPALPSHAPQHKTEQHSFNICMCLVPRFSQFA